MGRTLAGVWAHPDDECYSMYGTVARHAADPSFRLVLLHATDGEAGEVAPEVPTTRAELGAWRRREDSDAWRALGREPDRHVWLAHPDGALAEVGADLLTAQVADFLRAERPDVVATFGPDGVTGHPDHIAIGAATERAFHRVRAEGGPGLQRLICGAIPSRQFELGQRRRLQAGLEPWDRQRVYHLRGTPDEHIGITVRNHDRLPRMLAAIKEHRSQRHVLFDAHGTDEAWMQVMTRETWVIAWPPPAAGAAMLDDVFDGLA